LFLCSFPFFPIFYCFFFSSCRAVWYCSEEHQKQDWPLHALVCVRSDPSNDPSQDVGGHGGVKRKFDSITASSSATPASTASVNAGADDDDDDILEVEALVSLNCPLTLERLKIPVRGAACKHATCFELEDYIQFCQESHHWKCPICKQKVAFEELTVNQQLLKVLQTVDRSVTQIRLHQDGTFSVSKTEILDDEDGVNDAPQSDTESDGKAVKRARTEPVDIDQTANGVGDVSNSFDSIWHEVTHGAPAFADQPASSAPSSSSSSSSATAAAAARVHHSSAPSAARELSDGSKKLPIVLD
jgi:MIZ/SP-RING zinc finger/MYND finger